MDSLIQSRRGTLGAPIQAQVKTIASISNPDAAPGGRSRNSRFTGRRVHFIGIGGCGMSGLARILLDSGAIVTGSEPSPNEQTFDLCRRGIKISRDQLGELLSREVDLVVRTAAVPDNNPEYLAARGLGIETIKYAQLLGRVMQERTGIAVAGTHGKSTTTAMISYVLTQCGMDPSFVVGGTSPQLGGSSHSGGGSAFVVEACEYDRSFHNLHPRIALITNVEEDHLDCYKDIGEIVGSFQQFVAKTPSDGLVIVNGEDDRAMQAVNAAAESTHFRIQTVSLSRGFDWSTRATGMEQGVTVGEVSRGGRVIGMLRLVIAGQHNLFNATMALAACTACGVEAVDAIEALNRFTGVDRRMSEVGQCNGAILIDDYGHHPTEIRATLKALQSKYRPTRIFCVFQPHQHSRTRFLMEDFANSFAEATETIVPDIYFVRDSETERHRVSAGDLVERICRTGQRAKYIASFDEIAVYLRTVAKPGDLIVTMGAGNVWEIGRSLNA